MEENIEIKTWNQQLSEWYKDSGKSISQIVAECGIPQKSISEYINGTRTNLDRISLERKDVLYKLTGLECFKVKSPQIEMSEPKEVDEKLPTNQYGKLKEFEQVLTQPDLGSILGKTFSEIIQPVKEGLNKIIEQATSDLTGEQKLKTGLLKAQLYRPTTEQRTNAIMELLDILSEEIDYFRTAPDKEKQVLVERLQKEPESFGYITQMLNIIYGGKKLDSWMLMAQPPSKLKKIMRNK